MKISPRVEKPIKFLLSEKLLILLLLAWTAGLYTGDVARALQVCCLLIGLVTSLRRQRFTLFEKPVAANYTPFVLAWLCVLCAMQFSSWVLGKQGLDFAIFSQTIESVSQRGGLYTSFIGDGWRNFLTHHFSPILYVPGLLGFVGLNGPQAAILFHVFCVGFALLCMYRFTRTLGFGSSAASIMLVLLCLNPTFRAGLSWEVHDETYALPFIGFAYERWLKKDARGVMIAILLACLCKETMFIFAALFGAMILLWSRLEGERVAEDSICRSGWVCVFFGLLGAVAYFYVYDLFFARTFSAAARIAEWSYFMSVRVLYEKAHFFVLLLLPMLALPLLSLRGVVAGLPALTFLGPIALTNFESMHLSYNYYGVVPTYILFFATAFTVKQRWPRLQVVFPVTVAIACVSLCLSLARFNRPGAIVREALKSEWLSARDLKLLPPEAAFIADDFTLPFLLDKERVNRLWTAERVSVPWQYIVIRRGAEGALKRRFVKRSHICLESSDWIVRCRRT